MQTGRKGTAITSKGHTRRAYLYAFLFGLPLTLTLGILGWPTVLGSIESDRSAVWGVDQDLIRETISEPVSRNHYPHRVIVHHQGHKRAATIHYTFDAALQAEMEAVLKAAR